MLRMSCITVPLDGIRYLESAATVLENNILPIYGHLTTLLKHDCICASVSYRWYLHTEKGVGKDYTRRYSLLCFSTYCAAFSLQLSITTRRGMGGKEL
jgi:hypothetical protein